MFYPIIYRLILCIRLSGGAFSVPQDILPLNVPFDALHLLVRRCISIFRDIFPLNAPLGLPSCLLQAVHWWCFQPPLSLFNRFSRYRTARYSVSSLSGGAFSVFQDILSPNVPPDALHPLIRRCISVFRDIFPLNGTAWVLILSLPAVHT